MNALNNVRLGLSISESPDLLRLGFLEDHFRIALAEIARCILVTGGQLSYGGHLKNSGYTAFLIHELERYSRRDRPLQVCLAWSVHSQIKLCDLKKSRDNLGLYGQIICLDISGNKINQEIEREEIPPCSEESEVVQASLTGLRKYMTINTDGRILIGGKRNGFIGNLPGVLEEALLSIQNEKPLYLAGGFGGITSDMARILGLVDSKWFPDFEHNQQTDERTIKGLEMLSELVGTSRKFCLNNGLTWDENIQLAICHRPSEIAALVCLGLGRRFHNK